MMCELLPGRPCPNNMEAVYTIRWKLLPEVKKDDVEHTSHVCDLCYTMCPVGLVEITHKEDFEE